MIQIHGLSTVLSNQGIAPPTYSSFGSKHFHINVIKTLSVSLCSFLLPKEKHKQTKYFSKVVNIYFTKTQNDVILCSYCQPLR